MKTIVRMTSRGMKIARQRTPPPNLPGAFFCRPTSACSDESARRGRRVVGWPLVTRPADDLLAASAVFRRFPVPCRRSSVARVSDAFARMSPPDAGPAAGGWAELANGSPAGNGSGACRTARRAVPRPSERQPDSRWPGGCASLADGRFDLRPVDAARSAAALIDGEPWSSHNADGPTGGDGARRTRG